MGHDGSDLFVRFNSGALWRYKGVPAEYLSAMKSAPSVGRYFALNIKPKFDGSRIGESV